MSESNNAPRATVEINANLLNRIGELAAEENVSVDRLITYMYLAYLTERDSVRPGREQFYTVLRQAHADSVENGTDRMTMDEIDAIIAEVRAEMRAEQQTFAKTA